MKNRICSTLGFLVAAGFFHATSRTQTQPQPSPTIGRLQQQVNVRRQVSHLRAQDAVANTLDTIALDSHSGMVNLSTFIPPATERAFSGSYLS